MEVTIKKATLENLKDIQKLSLIFFEKEYDEYDKSLNLDWTFGEVGTKYFKKKITHEDSIALVAIVDDEVVGYLTGGLYEKPAHRKLSVVAELENIFILKDHRSKSIGEKLYHEFKTWCKSKNVDNIKVEVSSQNELAIKFYKREGFKDRLSVLETDL